MIYRDHKQKQSTTYDFRETAPQTVDTAALDTDDKTNNVRIAKTCFLSDSCSGLIRRKDRCCRKSFPPFCFFSVLFTTVKKYSANFYYLQTINTNKTQAITKQVRCIHLADTYDN